MSLKRRDDSKSIAYIQTEDVVFHYAFLVSPRPETDFNPGTYGAELVITDEQTKEDIKEYLKQTLELGKEESWGGKIPKDIHLPIKYADEDSNLEEGTMILKTSSKKAPDLWIRDSDSGRAYEVEEDEIDEIYSGMIGIAVVVFRHYDYKGKRGVKAYLNAVCKTEDGIPIGARLDYKDAFSIGSQFDEDESPLPKKGSKKKAKVEEEEEDADVNLDDLVKGSKPSSKGKSTSKSKSKSTGSKSKKDDIEDIEDINDLLNR